MKDAGAGALVAAKALDGVELELARLACPLEQAALALRRRGRIVYRMTVLAADEPRLVLKPADFLAGLHSELETDAAFRERLASTWYVSTLGRNVTAEQLVAEAGKLRP